VAKITIALGMLLTVLGLVAYFALATGEDRSITALIPTFFGVPMLMLGTFALGDHARRRKILMHVAVVLGVLGIIGPGMRLVKAEAVTKATTVQGFMAALCLVYVIVAITSFVKARRAPNA
jgi:hypothetical protein